jgi:multisubunit Na+/H+ antiporter MnhB subunit
MAVCGFKSTIIMWRIVDEVNSKLPRENRFAPIGWWGPLKRRSLFAEYRRLYPDGRRIMQLLSVGLVGLLGVMFCLVLLGQPGGAVFFGVFFGAYTWLMYRSYRPTQGQ